jgi:hypothetical protein
MFLHPYSTKCNTTMYFGTTHLPRMAGPKSRMLRQIYHSLLPLVRLLKHHRINRNPTGGSDTHICDGDGGQNRTVEVFLHRFCESGGHCDWISKVMNGKASGQY